MASGEVVEIVRHFLGVSRDRGVPVCAAYLYGSQARGTAGPDSDIDVAVILENAVDSGERLRHWYTLQEIAGDVDLRLSVYAVQLEKFQSDTATPLLSAVRREGIEIAA
jgi:predicted nucleotidyltransferase